MAPINKTREYSSSRLGTFMACPRLYKYRYVLRLMPKEDNIPMSVGRVGHEAMHAWYATGNLPLALSKFAVLPSPVFGESLTSGFMEGVFKQYVERFGRGIGETIHLEKTGTLEIGERLYTFRIDRIAKWNGKIYVNDYKFTSKLGKPFSTSWRPSIQMDGYCWGCREVCGECGGVVVDGISTAKNPKERFQRVVSGRSPYELDQFKKTFSYWAGKIEEAEETGEFAMNSTYCNSYYSRCEFFDLCVYGETEKIIALNFKPRPPRPVETTKTFETFETTEKPLEGGDKDVKACAVQGM